MAGKGIKDGEDDQILNNRPPDLDNDFGIVTEEDKLDRELMPDAASRTSASAKTEK